jgi:hypothetical protein
LTTTNPSFFDRSLHEHRGSQVEKAMTYSNARRTSQRPAAGKIYEHPA